MAWLASACESMIWNPAPHSAPGWAVFCFSSLLGPTCFLLRDAVGFGLLDGATVGLRVSVGGGTVIVTVGTCAIGFRVGFGFSVFSGPMSSVGTGPGVLGGAGVGESSEVGASPWPEPPSGLVEDCPTTTTGTSLAEFACTTTAPTTTSRAAAAAPESASVSVRRCPDCPPLPALFAPGR